MYKQRYQLYLTGKVLPGTDVEQAAGSLAQIFRSETNKTRRFFDGTTRSVVKLTDLAKLKGIQEKLINAGIICRIGLVFDAECFRHGLVDANWAKTSANDEQGARISFPHKWLSPFIYSSPTKLNINLNGKSHYTVHRSTRRIGWAFLYLASAFIAAKFIYTLLQPISLVIDNLLINRIIGVGLFFLIWIGTPLFVQARSRIKISTTGDSLDLEQVGRKVFPKKRFLLTSKSGKFYSAEYLHSHRECLLYDADDQLLYRAADAGSADDILLKGLNTLRDLIEETPMLGSLIKSDGPKKPSASFHFYNSENHAVATMELYGKRAELNLHGEAEEDLLLAMGLIVAGA